MANTMGKLSALIKKGLEFNLACGHETNEFNKDRVDMVKLGMNGKYDSYVLGITDDGYQVKAKVMVYAIPVKEGGTEQKAVGTLKVG